ncbi:unnamed protein product [Urochloa humidicola]
MDPTCQCLERWPDATSGSSILVPLVSGNNTCRKPPAPASPPEASHRLEIPLPPASAPKRNRRTDPALPPSSSPTPFLPTQQRQGTERKPLALAARWLPPPPPRRRWTRCSSSPRGRTCGCGAACTAGTSTPTRTGWGSPFAGAAAAAGRWARRGGWSGSCATAPPASSSTAPPTAATSPDPAPPGHRGHRVVQGEHGENGVDPILWKPVGSGHAGYVLLRHVSYRLLRANGRYRRWLAGVTVDDFDNQSTMMHWRVEAIPPRPAPRALPPPAPINRGGFRGLFLLHEEPVVLQRTIRYVQADNQGNFNMNPNGWATFQFHGRSVFHLRSEVANHVGLALFFFRVIVCVRAGRYGQPTPLLIDLPCNEETLDVVAFVIGTPAAAALRYPDVDAR